MKKVSNINCLILATERYHYQHSAVAVILSLAVLFRMTETFEYYEQNTAAQKEEACYVLCNAMSLWSLVPFCLCSNFYIEHFNF